MALGATTYKTPNAISQIGEDLTGKEGYGVYLAGQGLVYLATKEDDVPYGIVVVGGESQDGTYPRPIAGSAIEFVDQLGCVVQVAISVNANVVAGEFLLIDSAEGNGTFTGTNAQPPNIGDWLWGYALTDAQAGEQCLMRFQPFIVYSTYPGP